MYITYKEKKNSSLCQLVLTGMACVPKKKNPFPLNLVPITVSVCETVCCTERATGPWWDPYHVWYGNKNGHHSITNFIKICSLTVCCLSNFYAPVSLMGIGMVDQNYIKMQRFGSKKIKRPIFSDLNLVNPVSTWLTWWEFALKTTKTEYVDRTEECPGSFSPFFTQFWWRRYLLKIQFLTNNGHLASH